MAEEKFEKLFYNALFMLPHTAIEHLCNNSLNNYNIGKETAKKIIEYSNDLSSYWKRNRINELLFILKKADRDEKYFTKEELLDIVNKFSDNIRGCYPDERKKIIGGIIKFTEKFDSEFYTEHVAELKDFYFILRKYMGIKETDSSKLYTELTKKSPEEILKNGYKADQGSLIREIDVNTFKTHMCRFSYSKIFKVKKNVEFLIVHPEFSQAMLGESSRYDYNTQANDFLKAAVQCPFRDKAEAAVVALVKKYNIAVIKLLEPIISTKYESTQNKRCLNILEVEGNFLNSCKIYNYAARDNDKEKIEFILSNLIGMNEKIHVISESGSGWFHIYAADLLDDENFRIMKNSVALNRKVTITVHDNRRYNLS